MAEYDGFYLEVEYSEKTYGCMMGERMPSVRVVEEGEGGVRLFSGRGLERWIGDEGRLDVGEREITINVKADDVGLGRVAVCRGDGVVVGEKGNESKDEWEEIKINITAESGERYYVVAEVWPEYGWGEMKKRFWVDADGIVWDELASKELRIDNMRIEARLLGEVTVMRGDGGGGGGEKVVVGRDMWCGGFMGKEGVRVRGGGDGIGGDMWLGEEGEEVLLPAINWMSGGEGEVGISVDKEVEKIKLIDGRSRAYVREKMGRRWELRWDWLDGDGLEKIKGLASKKGILRFKSNRGESGWRDVVVVEFKYMSVENVIGMGIKRYRVEMVLEECVR